MTRDVFAIGGDMVRDNPWTLPIAALGWMVPLITVSNYVQEAAFVQYWQARCLSTGARRRPATGIAEVIA